MPFDIDLTEIYDESFWWAKTLIERTGIESLTKEGKSNTSTTTDTLFAPLTIATAPEASRPALEKIRRSLGNIPNLITPRERQIILLAASAENHCNYCVAAHSTIAKGGLHTPAEVVAAVRDNTPP